MKPATYVLVHGAWHDGRCWQALAERLQAQGSMVLMPDLPGHGSNALPLEDVSLKRYVQCLQALLKQQAEPVVLLAHSMAGIPATMAACDLPDKIARLVYLCAYLPRPGDSVFSLIDTLRGEEPATGIEQAISLSADKRRCLLDPQQAAELFYHDLPEAEARHLVASLGLQSSLPLAAKARFSQELFESLNSVYIYCTRDRVIPPLHQRRMLARQSCRTLLQAELDHSPFHSNPDLLARLLLSCAEPSAG